MEEFVMHKKTILAGTFILLAAVLVLSACGTKAPPAAPTADANAVYTQAAATVSAGLTQAAEKNPTATPAPPTATPTNVNEKPSPTVAQPGPGAETATATLEAGVTPQATATTAGATAVSTATKAAGATAAVSDKAEWVAQSPPDKVKIQVNATFNMKFVMKNTGKTTWTKRYALRYYAGPISAPKDINLTKEVKPGETVEILFVLVAPDTAKKENLNIWVLSTDQGVNFSTVTLDFETTN
jgi:hypothetical protein